MAPKVEVFKGKDGDWYWHLKADNGQIIADGGEGYKNKLDALVSYHEIVHGADDIEIDPTP